MDLGRYVENIHDQLTATAASGGEEARALADAAEEITVELAPGSVELRLRGREPEFVVTPPPAEVAPEPEAPAWTPPAEDDDGGVTRINLRMPDRLKARVEQAAAAENLSANSWLVRAASAAVERPAPDPRRPPRAPHSGQRFTGWAR